MVIQEFRWQSGIKHVKRFSDSEWVGDKKSRKSISGGICMVGTHATKTWPSTQHLIALSLAEAELYALLRCACQAIGIPNLAIDFGINVQTTIRIDASAALAIIQRQGLCKFRHIDAHWFCIQERVNSGDVKTNKMNGKENLADLRTKHLSREEIKTHK